MFPDVAMEIMAMLQAVYRLDLRKTQGPVVSNYGMTGSGLAGTALLNGGAMGGL